jgi:hypothetical protein
MIEIQCMRACEQPQPDQRVNDTNHDALLTVITLKTMYT